jgi:hypothetical protein
MLTNQTCRAHLFPTTKAPVLRCPQPTLQSSARCSQDGVGRHEAPNGWVYRGSWKAGLRHGQGVLTSALGHRFIGKWLKGHLPQGQLLGRFLGDYVGRFRATDEGGDARAWPLLRHGHGRWEGCRGESYDGQWTDDYFEGYGTLRTERAVYEGQFKRSRRLG